MTWRTEHPWFPEADMPAVPAWWEDRSWHNDAMPMFHAGMLLVAVDPADPALSDFAEWRRDGTMRRFQVARMDPPPHDRPEWGPQLDGGVVLLGTDDWGEVLRLVADNFLLEG